MGSLTNSHLNDNDMTILFWIFMAMLGKATLTGWSHNDNE